MPHLTVTHSANVALADEWPRFFDAAHKLLADHLPTDIETCRSRAIPCHDWAVGTLQHQAGFAHAAVQVMPGRSPETLKATAEALLACMQDHFTRSSLGQPCQLSVEVTELASSYVKMTL